MEAALFADGWLVFTAAGGFAENREGFFSPVDDATTGAVSERAGGAELAGGGRQDRDDSAEGNVEG